MDDENYHLANAREMYRNGHREAAAKADQMAVSQLLPVSQGCVRLFFRTPGGALITHFDVSTNKPPREQIQEAWEWFDKVRCIGTMAAVLCYE